MWFWSLFPWWLMKFSTFHVLIGFRIYLEKGLFRLLAIFNSFLLLHCKSPLHIIYWSLIGYTIYKNFLPFSWLSFYFLYLTFCFVTLTQKQNLWHCLTGSLHYFNSSQTSYKESLCTLKNEESDFFLNVGVKSTLSY